MLLYMLVGGGVRVLCKRTMYNCHIPVAADNFYVRFSKLY